MVGQCHFQQEWFDKEEYKVWLARIDGNPFQAHCLACRKSFDLRNMGESAVKSHMAGAKHSKRVLTFDASVTPNHRVVPLSDVSPRPRKRKSKKLEDLTGGEDPAAVMRDVIAQQRVKDMLKEAILVLCKNGLNFAEEFCVEGLLGITLDKKDIFLVKIDETIQSKHTGGVGVGGVQSSPIVGSSSSVPPASHGKQEGVGSIPQQQRLLSGGSAYGMTCQPTLSPGGDRHIKTECSPDTGGPLDTVDSGEGEDDQVIIIKEEPSWDMVTSVKEEQDPVDNENVKVIWHPQEVLFPPRQDESSYQRMPTETSGTSLHCVVSQPMPSATYNSPSPVRSRPASKTSVKAHKKPRQTKPLQSIPGDIFSDPGATIEYNKEVIYRCKYCNMTFASVNAYKNHVLRHQGIFRTRCKYCDKGFNSTLDLKGHIAANHTKQNDYACEVCNKSFSYQQSYRRHMRTVHSVASDRELSKAGADVQHNDMTYVEATEGEYDESGNLVMDQTV